jgi:hypothetical protein
VHCQQERLETNSLKTIRKIRKLHHINNTYLT